MREHPIVLYQIGLIGLNLHLQNTSKFSIGAKWYWNESLRQAQPKDLVNKLINIHCIFFFYNIKKTAINNIFKKTAILYTIENGYL